MTPITPPPPGLLDKVAEAIHAERSGRHDSMTLARAAWDAVVEGLGLREKVAFGGRHLVSERLEPRP